MFARWLSAISSVAYHPEVHNTEPSRRCDGGESLLLKRFQYTGAGDWNRDPRFVILPVCLLLTSTVAGCMVTVLFATIDPNASIFDPRLLAWITVFYSVAVAQNFITTSLMAFRLWQREKESSRARIGAGVFLPTIRILAESAALYLFVEILLLSLYAVDYNVQYILLETVTPVVAITFGMITVRVNLRSQHSSQIFRGHRSKPATLGSMPMRHIVVNIRPEVEEDFTRSEGRIVSV
ncbi:hypothetical protein B0H19DRAFT_1337545 [Mycena capillaripes]|nr:hypothetical protein B0H19DRAFT_1337545 [Mycena capillaripes]